MIDVLPIFPLLNKELLNVLKSLKPKDWERKTVCPKWNIKDIVAHLLDTNLRRLTIGRDGYFKENANQFTSHEELVGFLNKLNADWVEAMKRLSPNILIEMIEKYQNELIDYFKELNPFDTALFPVLWAGKDYSEIWFDIAREYSERWLHQQQIRQALNDQILLESKFYHPFLEISMQALPHTYKNIEANNGDTLKVEIVGEAGGTWCIIKKNDRWNFTEENEKNPKALIYIDQQIAWLLFSGGINPMDASQYYQIHGDFNLASQVLKMKSVMM
ncbi:hypothetical protein A5893_10555 [Pedobacter psychrophilus]|uniref:Mycothiol-dependent maleylpyruvate isomerase metal-binding domain-containing protein n=1 Tax=Pedobacter psychrophilus TaxID=1826909 RepID=A0A179DE59_9SPHI|nr:maleylpyruvate isomerase N-terminal domain-containing protein [Pedobacter psychrophilus]OAQ39102.1 hypothetical protein A5893_10555 [Pedobacter psychrophilus]